MTDRTPADRLDELPHRWRQLVLDGLAATDRRPDPDTWHALLTLAELGARHDPERTT
jgi:hypothetical protein